jgi:hypothetical protein
MLTFETAAVQGSVGILEKLQVRHCHPNFLSDERWSDELDTYILMQNLPFQKVRHQVSTLDAQPSGETGGIMVLVTGALLVRTQDEACYSTSLREH